LGGISIIAHGFIGGRMGVTGWSSGPSVIEIGAGGSVKNEIWFEHLERDGATDTGCRAGEYRKREQGRSDRHGRDQKG